MIVNSHDSQCRLYNFISIKMLFSITMMFEKCLNISPSALLIYCTFRTRSLWISCTFGMSYQLLCDSERVDDFRFACSPSVNLRIIEDICKWLSIHFITNGRCIGFHLFCFIYSPFYQYFFWRAACLLNDFSTGHTIMFNNTIIKL